MADYLPKEVWVDIVIRLPVKTILVCTSVCKSWHSIITSPNFINLHLNRPPRNLIYDNSTHDDLLLVRICESKKELFSLYCDTDAFEVYAEIDFPFQRTENRYYRIVGSCNGVLCLTDDQHSYEHTTILWNPSVRKWVTLPRPRVTYSTHGEFVHAIGFGYDAKNNDYKVVRIVYPVDEGDEFPLGCVDEDPEVDVYNLSTGTWRDISHLTRLPCTPSYLVGGTPYQAYVNGACHWIGLDSDRESLSTVVVSFDMSDEVFRCIEPPAGLISHYWDYRVSPYVVQGSLALVEVKEEEKRWSIWVMQEYGVSSSWCRKFNVDFCNRLDTVIGFRKNGHLLIATNGELLSHDPKAARVEELGICTKGFYPHSHSYTESLVLLLGSQSPVEENEGESGEQIASKGAVNRVVAGLEEPSVKASKV